MPVTTDERKAKSLRLLKALINSYNTIYIIERGHNPEGRIIDCYIFEIVTQSTDNESKQIVEPTWVTRHIANVIEEKYVENDQVRGLLIAGTGFSVEDQLADLLKMNLFPNSTATLHVKTL